MHSRITELLQYIDRQIAELRAAYHAVPDDRKAVRPQPDRWSPAEIVHHVVIIERRMLARLPALFEQARALPPESDASAILPTLDTDRMTNRARRIVTSDAGQPKDTDPSRVWLDLDTAHRDLRDAIVKADGLALGAVSAPHPAMGTLSGYGWIAFAGAHAARHAHQIREIQS